MRRNVRLSVKSMVSTLAACKMPQFKDCLQQWDGMASNLLICAGQKDQVFDRALENVVVGHHLWIETNFQGWRERRRAKIEGYFAEVTVTKKLEGRLYKGGFTWKR